MSMRIAKAVLVLGSPVDLLVLGPFGILGVPVITLLLGESVWPGLSRGRLALLGTVTVVTEAAVYAIAVFAFDIGLGGPTGAWFWAGPAVGWRSHHRMLVRGPAPLDVAGERHRGPARDRGDWGVRDGHRRSLRVVSRAPTAT